MHSLIPATHVAAFTSFVSATSKATKKALLLLSVAVLLAGGAAAVRAQSALDGFDPNANGDVEIVVVQPDGKILIGGTFTTLSPNGGAAVTRNRIARLNPDGTLDTAFNPNANATVNAIALQTDGKILVGGFFSGANSIGGQTRNRIARLDATTGAADLTFNPNANGFVYSIAVQTDGKILVGGFFSGASSIGGATRNYIARLDATNGAADLTFNPNANSYVRSIVVQADDKILVGGFFNDLGSGAISIGGATRNYIARLDPATGLADSFNPNADNIIYSIAVQADDKILAGGAFTSIGGQTRNRIARLDPTTGAADLTFNPNANGFVLSIAVQADGKILAGGNFNGANSVGGATRNYIARLNATTGAADSFDPSANSTVNAIAVQADGKILAGGSFTTFAPNGAAAITRNHIARLAAPIQLVNISSRAFVGTGDNVAIGGFIIRTDSGSTALRQIRGVTANTKRVLIRGKGPSLPLTGTLMDPVLDLFNSQGTKIDHNDNWMEEPDGTFNATRTAAIQGTGLAPSDPNEAALLETLNSDSSYTAILSGKNGGTGIGLVEVYDLEATSNTHLANISTRAFVDIGDKVLIGGLIVQGDTPARILLRAIGPSLSGAGISNPLPDPVLALYDSNGTVIRNNDDWMSDDAANISATGLAPSDPKESAILFTPTPGAYTAIVRGKNPNPTGIGLVEAFNVGPPPP